ncbi:MAG: hypothetical protein ACI8UR_001435 [Natronomonas sp.]|jgi:hypothetical protein|uniref:DUF7315 family membrane protein n=1 Tax=Natronomonas sp. TaxID=2184060 RepID=UPI003988AE61
MADNTSSADAAVAPDADTDVDAGESAGEEGKTEAEADTGAETPGGRDIVVPLRLYKTVTVFSTLFAIVSILLGFVLLDRGTQRATAAPEDVSLPLVALALGLIVVGSAVYAFSTRFRTEGMGKSKDDTDEPSDNG